MSTSYIVALQGIQSLTCSRIRRYSSSLPNFVWSSETASRLPWWFDLTLWAFSVADWHTEEYGNNSPSWNSSGIEQRFQTHLHDWLMVFNSASGIMDTLPMNSTIYVSESISWVAIRFLFSTLQSYGTFLAQLHHVGSNKTMCQLG